MCRRVLSSVNSRLNLAIEPSVTNALDARRWMISVVRYYFIQTKIDLIFCLNLNSNPKYLLLIDFSVKHINNYSALIPSHRRCRGFTGPGQDADPGDDRTILFTLTMISLLSE